MLGFTPSLFAPFSHSTHSKTYRLLVFVSITALAYKADTIAKSTQNHLIHAPSAGHRVSNLLRTVHEETNSKWGGTLDADNHGLRRPNPSKLWVVLERV